MLGFLKRWERSKSFQNSLDESIEKDIALGLLARVHIEWTMSSI